MQPGQGFTGPWTAGPYQADAGEIGGATYTFVNLAGSSTEDQEKVITALAANVASAVTAAIGVMHASVEAAMRGVFGGMGELLAAPAVPAGANDCRGLIGIEIQPFVASDEPTQEVLGTGAPVTLNGTAPATCGSGPQGTGPQTTAVFSVRRAPSFFSQSMPVTPLASGTETMEIVAVGLDGRVRYNRRAEDGRVGAWQLASQQTFSQSVPLVALAGMPELAEALRPDLQRVLRVEGDQRRGNELVSGRWSRGGE